jgi:hypothetical protein
MQQSSKQACLQRHDLFLNAHHKALHVEPILQYNEYPETADLSPP